MEGGLVGEGVQGGGDGPGADDRGGVDGAAPRAAGGDGDGVGRGGGDIPGVAVGVGGGEGVGDGRAGGDGVVAGREGDAGQRAALDVQRGGLAHPVHRGGDLPGAGVLGGVDRPCPRAAGPVFNEEEGVGGGVPGVGVPVGRHDGVGHSLPGGDGRRRRGQGEGDGEVVYHVEGLAEASLVPVQHIRGREHVADVGLGDGQVAVPDAVVELNRAGGLERARRVGQDGAPVEAGQDDVVGVAGGDGDGEALTGHLVLEQVEVEVIQSRRREGDRHRVLLKMVPAHPRRADNGRLAGDCRGDEDRHAPADVGRAGDCAQRAQVGREGDDLPGRVEQSRKRPGDGGRGDAVRQQAALVGREGDFVVDDLRRRGVIGLVVDLCLDGRQVVHPPVVEGRVNGREGVVDDAAVPGAVAAGVGLDVAGDDGVVNLDAGRGGVPLARLAEPDAPLVADEAAPFDGHGHQRGGVRSVGRAVVPPLDHQPDPLLIPQAVVGEGHIAEGEVLVGLLSLQVDVEPGVPPAVPEIGVAVVGHGAVLEQSVG